MCCFDSKNERNDSRISLVVRTVGVVDAADKQRLDKLQSAENDRKCTSRHLAVANLSDSAFVPTNIEADSRARCTEDGLARNAENCKARVVLDRRYMLPIQFS